MKLSYLCLVALISCAVPVFADDVITLNLDTPSFEKPAQTQQKKQTQNKVTSVSAKARSEKTIGRVGLVTADQSKIYAKQSSNSRVYSVCKKDTPIAVVYTSGDWYGVLMIDGSTGWIKSDFVKVLDYAVTPPDKQRGTLASRGGYDRGSDNPIIQTAMKYLGVPYVFGGTSTSSGIDCSAFVRRVFSEYGVELPRVARDQAKVGMPVAGTDLQSGDRLYFACKHSYVDHCAIYIGDGYFIHASASRGQVAVDNLSNKFYSSNLVAVMRS